MATLYFNNNGGNSDWQNLGNWWADADKTIPAAALPTSSDSVVLSAGASNSGSQPTVVNLTLEGIVLSLDITVSGTATFDASTLAATFTLTNTGLASFNMSAINNGTVTGDAAFDGNSTNNGTVSGNATFTNGSYHYGTVTGNATFTDSSPSDSSSVGGNYTATNGTYVYTGGGYGCIVGGNATFYGSHYGAVSVSGTTTLYDYSIIEGHAQGGLTVNDYGVVGGCGWLGTATFNDNSTNNWVYWNNYYDSAEFNDNAVNNSYVNHGTFNDSSQNSDNGWVAYSGGAVFNDDSVDAGSNYGAYYNDRSHANGNYNYLGAYFSGRSRATASVLEAYYDADIEITGGPIGSYYAYTGYNQVYTDITFTRAGLGINGSSILGLI